MGFMSDCFMQSNNERIIIKIILKIRKIPKPRRESKSSLLVLHLNSGPPVPIHRILIFF